MDQIIGYEVFIKLKNERNFGGNTIIFNKEKNNVEITYLGKNLNLFKELVYCYGFGDTKEIYGIEYSIKLNNVPIDKDFNFNLVNEGDKIEINYNDRGCFSLYSHIISYQIDDKHDDEYFLMKELEK